MTQVYDIIQDAGQPVAATPVQVELCIPSHTTEGFVTNAPYTVYTDSTGSWMLNLPSNDVAVLDEGTFYRVKVRGAEYDIVVPESDDPVQASTLIVQSPTPPGWGEGHSYDDSISDDTLGVLDPDTWSETLTTMLTLFGLGSDEIASVITGATPIFEFVLTQQPSDIKKALTNIVGLMSVMFSQNILAQSSITSVSNQVGTLTDETDDSLNALDTRMTAAEGDIETLQGSGVSITTGFCHSEIDGIFDIPLTRIGNLVFITAGIDLTGVTIGDGFAIGTVDEGFEGNGYIPIQVANDTDDSPPFGSLHIQGNILGVGHLPSSPINGHPPTNIGIDAFYPYVAP